MAPGRRPGARFDLPGLILLAAGLTALLLGASQGASAGWTAPATWVPLASGAALTACYAGWAARERLRRELTSASGRGGPSLAVTAGLAAVALALGVGAGALATLPGRIELDSQQYAIGSIVFDGTPLVRLHYAIARLLPLPATHAHDYAQSCGTGCTCNGGTRSSWSFQYRRSCVVALWLASAHRSSLMA